MGGKTERTLKLIEEVERKIQVKEKVSDEEFKVLTHQAGKKFCGKLFEVALMSGVAFAAMAYGGYLENFAA